MSNLSLVRDVDLLVLDLVDQVGSVGVDGIVHVLVMRGDAHGAVAHAELDVLAADLLAVRSLLGDGDDGLVDFLSAEESMLSGACSYWSLSTPMTNLLASLGSLDNAVAAVTGSLEDDVAAVGVHLGAYSLALGGIGEGLGVLRGDLDALTLLLVGVLNARGKPYSKVSMMSGRRQNRPCWSWWT